MHASRLILVPMFVVFISSAWAGQPSSHEQAALELLRLTGLERSMVAGATAMIESQAKVNPELAPYRDVMLEWARKYLTWEAMAPALVKIQVELFTEDELKEMIAFYRTPTGQKCLVKLPEMVQRGAAVGAELGKAHQRELEDMVLARKKELESEKKKPE